MKKIFSGMVLLFTLTACEKSLPQQGDYWLELKNVYGEWENAALITGYMDDYEACNEFLQALHEWNENNSVLAREYRCTPA